MKDPSVKFQKMMNAMPQGSIFTPGKLLTTKQKVDQMMLTNSTHKSGGEISSRNYVPATNMSP